MMAEAVPEAAVAGTSAGVMWAAVMWAAATGMAV